MNQIYALPDKPSARDIIRRSIVAHPTTLRDRLIAQAEIHGNYNRLTSDRLAAESARTQRNACLAAYSAVGEEDIDEICGALSLMVITLNAAAKLQCLPPHMAQEAAAAWDAGER